MGTLQLVTLVALGLAAYVLLGYALERRRLRKIREAADQLAGELPTMADAIRASAERGVRVRDVLLNHAQNLWRQLTMGGRFSLRCEWRMELWRDGRLRTAADLGPNLVVNTGLTAIMDRLFNSATVQGPAVYIAIGTDATAEDAAQTGLLAEVARAGAAANFTAGAPGVATLDHTFPAAGGYEPATIVECGLFDLAAAGVMFCRKTGMSFTKESADTLKVVAVLQVTPA